MLYIRNSILQIVLLFYVLTAVWGFGLGRHIKTASGRKDVRFNAHLSAVSCSARCYHCSTCITRERNRFTVKSVMAFYDSDPAIAAVILLITKNIALPL
jgi:hypothetical protein